MLLASINLGDNIMAATDSTQATSLLHIYRVTEYALSQPGDDNTRPTLTSIMNLINDIPTTTGTQNILPVGYVSQYGTGADEHNNDCGAAAGAMLVRAYTGITATPNDFYNKSGLTGDVFLSATQIVKILQEYGVSTQWRTSLNITDLYQALVDVKPVIVLLKYGVIRDAMKTESEFAGPHFMTVIGMDIASVIVHDPLWRGEGGKAMAIPMAVFKKAWIDVGHDTAYPNPERGAIIPKIAIGTSMKQVRVTAYALNIRSGPGVSNPSLGFLKKDDIVTVYEIRSGWGRIDSEQQRWISLAYTQAV